MKLSFGVKAVIVREDGRVLMVKRSADETHLQGYWEVPGGRVEFDQSPKKALREEVEEETSLEIEILEPFATWHFEKSEEEQIIGVDFLCRPKTENVQLSEEHSEFSWVEMKDLGDFKVYDSIRKNIEKGFEIFSDRYGKTPGLEKRVGKNEASSDVLEAEEFYSRHADRFEKQFDRSRLTGEYFKMIESFVSSLSGNQVLDAGCGPGRDIKILEECGLEVTGVDISDEMVEKARENTSSEVLKKDLRDLDFEKNSLDGVWCSSTIFFLEKSEMIKVLDSFSTILKPDGVLFVNFKEGNGQNINSFWGDSVREHWIPEKEAEKMLEGAGFTLTETWRSQVTADTDWISYLCRNS